MLSIHKTANSKAMYTRLGTVLKLNKKETIVTILDMTDKIVIQSIVIHLML